MQIRQQVLTAEPRCVECLRQDRLRLATEVDHILPLHKGGTDEFTNLQGLCAPCHEDKTRADMGRSAKMTIGADGWPVTAGT